MTLTKSQAFLLAWLSQEDWSAYGECHGDDLDALYCGGLVTYAQTPPGARTGVALTDAGRAALEQGGQS